MEELLNVPYEERDEAWEAAFFKELPECQFDLLSDSPIQGPDGLPYLAVEIVDQGEPAKDIFDWLGEKGVGLAVNPNNEQPDYIFSYGMIWNFLVRDEFVTDAEVEGENGEVEMEEGQEMVAGTPSETYLPPKVRGIFKEFLIQQGVLNPRIVLLSQDGENYDMCFSLESLGNPPQEEWQGILEGFSWFFPLHYSFSIISEGVIQGIDFVDL